MFFIKWPLMENITHQYIDVLEIFLPKLRPRLAIIGCFVGNDFIEDFARQKLPATKQSGRKGMHLPKLRSVLRTSPVVNLVKQALWKLDIFRRVFNTLAIRNDRITLYEIEDSQYQRDIYGPTLAAYEDLAQISRASGIPILVVIIPDHLQVLDPEIFIGKEIDKPQRILIDQLTKVGLPYVDLLPVFRAFPNREQLFFREDRHWTKQGHALAGSALIPRVLEVLSSSKIQMEDSSDGPTKPHDARSFSEPAE